MHTTPSIFPGLTGFPAADAASSRVTSPHPSFDGDPPPPAVVPDAAGGAEPPASPLDPPHAAMAMTTADPSATMIRRWRRIGSPLVVRVPAGTHRPGSPYGTWDEPRWYSPGLDVHVGEPPAPVVTRFGTEVPPHDFR
jgi:hypothetical protein